MPRNFVNATAPSTWFPHAVIVSSVDMMVCSSVMLAHWVSISKNRVTNSCKENQTTYFVQREHQYSKHRTITLRCDWVFQVVIQLLDSLAISLNCLPKEFLSTRVLPTSRHSNSGSGHMQNRRRACAIVQWHEVLQIASRALGLLRERNEVLEEKRHRLAFRCERNGGRHGIFEIPDKGFKVKRLVEWEWRISIINQCQDFLRMACIGRGPRSRFG